MPKPCRISLLATVLFSSALGVRFGAAPEVVAFTHVAVVDPGGTATERDRTVVVTGDRIAEIARTSEVRIPPGARVVDATGHRLGRPLRGSRVTTTDTIGMSEIRGVPVHRTVRLGALPMNREREPSLRASCAPGGRSHARWENRARRRRS